MRVLALLNAEAGSGPVASPGTLDESVSQAFAAHGVLATVRLVSGTEMSAALAAAAGAPGFDALVVGGGDGSVRSAAEALAGSTVPLGVLPLGTLNHFAKDLGLPLAPADAIGAIAAGVVRAVDVGELNGHIFVNNSSVGLYPFMVEQRAIGQRRGLSKFHATIPAIVRTVRGASWHRLSVVAQGSRKRIRTPVLFVGNNLYDVGLRSLGNRRCLDKGELGVFVVKRQTWLGLLLLVAKVVFDRTDPRRDMERFRCSDVEIASHAKRLLVSLDGEVVRLQPPLRYRSRPGALKVLVPAGEPRAEPEGSERT